MIGLWNVFSRLFFSNVVELSLFYCLIQIDFFEEWEPRRNLSQLPNFAFSVALAHFHLSQPQNGISDTTLADKMLQDALIMFPGALQQLLDKCSVVVDSEMASHPFFTVDANKKLVFILIHNTPIKFLYFSLFWGDNFTDICILFLAKVQLLSNSFYCTLFKAFMSGKKQICFLGFKKMLTLY